MDRAVIKIGHVQLVTDVDSATELFRRLRNLEILELEWDSASNKTNFLLKTPDFDFLTLQYISEETYGTAKLLAKANEQGEAK
jgi:hypothetical protein